MEASPDNNPYSAPVATVTPRHVLPPLAQRARAARSLLLLNVPFTAVQIAIRILWLAGVTDFGQVGSASVGGLAWRTFNGSSTMLGLATPLAFLLWFHAAYVRAHSGVPLARFTAGFSVVSWFIPVANFIVPLLATRHLWQLSRGGADWRREKAPSYIVEWWCVWMLSHFVVLAAVVSQAVVHWPDFGGLAGLTGPSFIVAILLSSVFSLCALPLVLRLVREITALQRERLGVD